MDEGFDSWQAFDKYEAGLWAEHRKVVAEQRKALADFGQRFEAIRCEMYDAQHKTAEKIGLRPMQEILFREAMVDTEGLEDGSDG